MSGVSSPITELAALKEEHEKLLAAYGRLKWAIDGVKDDVAVALGVSPLWAKIIAVLISGRAYTTEQILHAVWDSKDVGEQNVIVNLSAMRRKFPWFKVSNVGGFGSAAYQLSADSIDYIKTKIAEL